MRCSEALGVNLGSRTFKSKSNILLVMPVCVCVMVCSQPQEPRTRVLQVRVWHWVTAVTNLTLTYWLIRLKSD